MGTATRQFEKRAVVRIAVRLLIPTMLVAVLALAYPIRRVADTSRRNFEACVASRISDAQRKQTPAERYAQLGECAAST